jgi:hypothetical protein
MNFLQTVLLALVANPLGIPAGHLAGSSSINAGVALRLIQSVT